MSRRSRKGVSGNPEKRARDETAKQAAAVEAARRVHVRRAGIGLVGCLVAAVLHTYAVLWVIAVTHGDWSASILVLVAPALLTAVFVPHARRHGWHRWGALVGLAITTIPDVFGPVVLVASTWILYRFWVTEGLMANGLRCPAWLRLRPGGRTPEPV